MCSGGGPVITMETSWFQRYRCNVCDTEFKSMGKSPMCPSCHSHDLVELSHD